MSKIVMEIQDFFKKAGHSLNPAHFQICCGGNHHHGRDCLPCNISFIPWKVPIKVFPFWEM